MKTLMIKTMVPAIALAVIGSLAGTARAADPAVERGPYIKNLMAPTYRAIPSATHGELTKKDIKRLSRTAETREDHLTIARFWTAEANKLEAQAAGYEQAAAVARRGPVVKNLMAPNTAARWESLAEGLRNEATSDRALAASHEQMAREV